MKTFRKLLISIFLLSPLLVWAQPFISTQSHEGAVTSIFSFDSKNYPDGTFYSAGKDGFVIKWDSVDGIGEQYQITDLQIQKIIRNPVTNDIAVYETDGVSTFRVSVLDSKSFSRRYTKRYSSAVSMISFSEGGNYLFVGTTTVNGMFILDAKTGVTKKQPSDISGIITFAKSGPSEKTALLYSSSGYLYYYDLENLGVFKKYSVDNQLEQISLFGNSRFFAGVRGNLISVYDAASGKKLLQQSASAPLLCASDADEDSEGLYFITSAGRNNSIKIIKSTELLAYSRALQKRDSNAKTPSSSVIKTFTSLRNKDSFTSVGKDSSKIILGTASGNIYTVSDIPESEMFTLEAITEKMYRRIYDISNDGEDFYMLTGDTIYKSSFDTMTITSVGRNSGYENLLHYGSSVILWTKDSRKNVQIMDLSVENSVAKLLFTPKAEINNLRICQDKLVYVAGNKYAGLYDFATKRNSIVYTGISVQDAVILADGTMYVAKSAVSESDSCLISVNTSTKETAPVNFEGNVVFSLSYDYENPDYLYGIVINSSGSSTSKVFSLDIDSGKTQDLLRLADEDNSAFTVLYTPVIYTNLGKNQVYACNVESRKNMLYRRSSSLPLKVERIGSRIAVLNRNGSISWYTTTSQAAETDWYLTVDNSWYER
ncbi:WD40 repeat domain-containing protein [Treponema sp.]|uniref:WD40 repeat domain-containing protein n=1 Tax=Treponema sp. TaxID=166 RepID=UPI0025FCAB55|nr:WD40 repeat domain-containing protein [Treponema sp.]MCR5218348.1 WD40 repeat domain-containing protein [Treponema sp.]